MSIEEIAARVMAGILSNPKCLESFDDDPNNIMKNVTHASIMYAEELKRQLKEGFTNDEFTEYEIINE